MKNIFVFLGVFLSQILLAGTSPPLYQFTAPLSITNGVVAMTPASGSVAGYVTTGTQSFAGNKTFNGTVTLTAPIFSVINNGGNVNIPAGPETLVGRATTDTLTNKTLTAPVIATIVNSGTLTLPTSTDTLVGRATTDTLTNKTLTAPIIASIVNSGTLTLPTSSDTLVGRATTDTLTNKTLSSGALSGTFSGSPTLSGTVTFGNIIDSGLAASQAVLTNGSSQLTTVAIGNLTDAGTDGITVTGGTNAVLGTGAALSQHVADSTHNGYLLQGDWNTFNGKQASGNYITALTGDVTATGPGSVAASVVKIQGTTVSGTTGTVNSVFSNSPTLVTPNLGTPSTLVATNATGTAAGLTAGTVTTNANLTGPITSVGNATSVASQTGTGTTFVMNTSPTLITPALGTPTALVGTNITGTAAGLTAGAVTTNANLTGPITSSGNATSIASQTGTGTTFAMSASPTFTGTVTLPSGSVTSSAWSTGSSTLSVGGQALVATGTVGAPSLSKTADTATGVNFLGGQQGELVAGGAEILFWSPSQVAFDQQARGIAGTVNLPTYSFQGDTHTGVLYSGSNGMKFSTNGVLAGSVDSGQQWIIGTFATSTNQILGANLGVGGNTAGAQFLMYNQTLNSGSIAIGGAAQSPAADGGGVIFYGNTHATKPDVIEFYTDGMVRGKIDINGVTTFSSQLIGHGTSTNDNAAAGYIGETASSVISSPVNIAASVTYQDLTNISLTAGDWDVSEVVIYSLNGATASGGVLSGISTNSGNDGTGLVYGSNELGAGAPTGGGGDVSLTIPVYRVSLSGTTTVYAKLYAHFSAGNIQAVGRLSARRVR